MTDKQINKAIAAHLGITRNVPDFTGDLNEMHEAEMTLTSVQLLEYIAFLFDACYEATVASARQRAKAFLRTLGKWEEVQG